MTIAAGFVNDRGVLLCADTLCANATTAYYRSKIRPVFLTDGVVLFAIAGNVVFLDSAVDRCEQALLSYDGSQRTTQGMIETIRNEWQEAYRAHNIYGQQVHSDDKILCAVHSTVDSQVALCCSSEQDLSASRALAEYIGCGCDIARYVVGSDFKTTILTERRTLECAISALARVKETMPTSVGGNLTAVNLTPTGQYTLYGLSDIQRIESYSRKFDFWNRSLLYWFMRLEDPDAFEPHGDMTIKHLCEVREQWKQEMESYNPYTDEPPIEIVEAFRQAKYKAGLV